MTRLRNALRRWLGITDPAPAHVEAPRPLAIAPSVLAQFGDASVVARPVKPPALLPGVIGDVKRDAALDPGMLGAYLAMDDAQLAPVWAFANDLNCGLGFPGYAFLSELAQRSEYRAPAETIADEMTRKFIKLITKDKTGDTDEEAEPDVDGKDPNKGRAVGRAGKSNKPGNDEVADENDADEEDTDEELTEASGAEDKIAALEDALKEFNVADAFRRVAMQDGLFGRSQLFIDIDTDGAEADDVRQLPLVVSAETIKKGSLKGFKVIEPIWTTPYSYNAQDAAAPDFYKPRAWYVLGKRIHASRLLTFVSREVPDLLKPAYNFGGLSLSQLMEPYVNRWFQTVDSVNKLISNFSILTLATDMNATLSGAPDAKGGLFDRAKLFQQTRNNQGLMLLDKDREELTQQSVSLAGLSELQAQAQEHMAAPSHIPLVKLTGVTPDGLNASSEGEIQVFYDFIKGRQVALYTQHLTTVLQIIQLHLFGEIDDAITHEYVPLTELTQKEVSEVRKSDSDAGIAYINAGVISPDEERERLMSDPNSGYNNLSGEAPEPPMQQEFSLQQEGADNQHERDGESAEQAAKLAAKAKPPVKKN